MRASAYDCAVTRSSPRGRPEPAELAAWRSFLRAHAQLTRALEAELLAREQLSLAAYDVLVQLAEAPGRRLRMADLAEALLFSRSGVTRLVDRLERIGLVSRCRADDDGRGVLAELTQCGLDRLRAASTTHLQGVAQHFGDRLDAGQLDALTAICRTLAEPAEADVPAATSSSEPAATSSSEPDGPSI